MTVRRKIVTFACLTRFAVIIIQFVADQLIPDHSAAVFIYPKSNVTSTYLDRITTTLLGSLIRWDAQYFMHVSKYGYTYENTLAFFPLYPLIAKGITTVILYVQVVLNEDSLLLLTFTSLNIYFFVQAALALYDLGSKVVNAKMAYISAILFCINPATIFFVAPYSESLFSYLTFKMLLNAMLMFSKKSKKKVTWKSVINVILPLSLSTSVRSNGILNIGFVAYFTARSFYEEYTNTKSKKVQVTKCLQYILFLILIICCSLLPFIFVQLYGFLQFCRDFDHELPEHLVLFGESNNFVLPGMFSKNKQSWCLKTVPLAYSYIQDHYWNVGFLRYFEFKQLPNFLLALPILTFVIITSVKFFLLHKDYSMKLGLVRCNSMQNRIKLRDDLYYPQEMFVFVVHALFLSVFCFLCIHVQVTTRMICSASPVIYWFAAYHFDEQNNMLLIKSKNKLGQYLLYYFLSYSVLGTVLFCNFLPWT